MDLATYPDGETDEALPAEPPAEPPAALPCATPELVFYHDGVPDVIRPAPQQREWMEQAENRWPYRCLPLNIASCHGWELLCPETFTADWRGDTRKDGVLVTGGGPWLNQWGGARSHFGEGVLTFNLRGMFRTSPNFGLWIAGSPNRIKDGIQPLGAFVRTDWLNYRFTMNWRFTRPGVVTFEEGEPFCFVFPVPVGYLQGVRPRFEPTPPEVNVQIARFAAERASTPHPGKRYIRGQDIDGNRPVANHETRLRLADFA